MTKFTSPTDIARESLRLLAIRQLPPTPENYLQLYHEIAGLPPTSGGAEAEKVLAKIAAEFPRVSPKLARLADTLAKAAADKDWDHFHASLLEFAEAHGRTSPPKHSWAVLIRELIRLWEARQAGLTLARKRGSLDRVLEKSQGDGDGLYQKLDALLKNWSAGSAGDDSPGEPAPAEPAESGTGLFELLRELLAHALEFGVTSQLRHAPDLTAEARALAAKARALGDKAALGELNGLLKQFWFKLALRSEDGEEIEQGLLALLRLLIENTTELVDDDQWLRGQVAMVHEIIGQPLNRQVLAGAERHLKEVIYNQGVLRKNLAESKTALKNMIASFIDRLGDVSESAGDYHTKIETYSKQIAQTNDVGRIGQILDEVARETRAHQTRTLRSRDELMSARKQAQEAEQKVKQLQFELEQVSSMVREDHLTGTLNRRGLDDAFEREASRADRRKSVLCVALLDVDNFKQINDRYGHQAGDDALVHLAEVIRQTIRPHDVVARFGGEEFTILLPDSDIDEAVAIMIRLQRALTKRFFLHNNERLLITFSAGVTARFPEEAKAAALERADQALYRAKQAGKNRVVTAGGEPP